MSNVASTALVPASRDNVGREGGGATEVGLQLRDGPTQCFRRRLPEQSTVGDGKASKLPEAVVGDDASDVRLAGIGPQERVPHEVHAAQGEVADRPHAQMFLAGGA